ncbi:MAG: CoA transferase, partial [Hyphomonas sp.]|nr:CoA transferase [Hyphomonas sp.]
TEWAKDESLAANNERVARRDEIIPPLRELFATYSKDELMAKLETTGLPFAPIQKPEDLFTDQHLTESGGLLEMSIPDGGEIALPAMPVAIDGNRPGLTLNPPEIGEHSEEVLKTLGLSESEISDLIDRGLVDSATHKTPQAAE